MQRLYHFSHDPSISRFDPRPGRLPEPLVWAVEESHAWSYCVPRDCPRACFWAGPGTSEADIERFLGGDSARIDMVLEDRWVPIHEAARIWRYTLPDETFILHDATAGHWVSRQPVTPLEVREVSDLPAIIRASGINLRSLPSIMDLWWEVITSTLEFSGTRLKFAHDYPEESGNGLILPP